jgi:mRNA interferase MazF
MKRFKDWIHLKEKLDRISDTIPHVSEGEIWWASLGENVGTEINGKSELFSRPVLIFKKFNRGFYFIIPLTTQSKYGSWYPTIRSQTKIVHACLHQARSIDYRRLSDRISKIDSHSFERIGKVFMELYIKNIPRPFRGEAATNVENP